MLQKSKQLVFEKNVFTYCFMSLSLTKYWSEVESSRTHFEVLGLRLEALSPRKLPCPRLEDSTIFEPLKFCWKTPETLRKICKDLFFWFPQVEIAWKKFFEDLFFFFFGEHLRLCPWSLALASRGSALGLEFFLCPWPWPRALCPRLHLWYW